MMGRPGFEMPASARDFDVNRASLENGGFLRRMGAYSIDGLILGTLKLPLSFFIWLTLKTISKDHDSLRGVNTGLGLLISCLMSASYFGWFYKNKCASIGKMVLKLRVYNQQTGDPLNYGETFLREVIGKPISAFLLMTGFLMAAFRDDGRALHDLIASSVVVREPVEGREM